MSLTTISASKVSERLIESLKAGINETATNRTVKYFTTASDYETRLKDVTTSIVGLMSTYGSVVSVNGDIFNVADYKVPSQLVDLINSGRIYGSSDAIDRVEPMFEIEAVSIPLTPSAFNKFFADFNSLQGDAGEKFSLNEGYVRRDVTLEDFQYLEDENGSLRKFHNDGFAAEICALVGLQLEAISSYLPKYEKPSYRGIGLWVLR
jgi:hypothetical protein